VLKKWLEGKTNRQLSIDEIDIFQKIVSVIAQTLDIQIKIDKICEKAIKETVPIAGDIQLGLI
jgi:hypothetical protein